MASTSVNETDVSPQDPRQADISRHIEQLGVLFDRILDDRQALLRALSVEDVDQIIEGIDHFIIGGDGDVRTLWQVYIDKLMALRAAITKAESRS